jgi:hypothetical protein
VTALLLPVRNLASLSDKLLYSSQLEVVKMASTPQLNIRVPLELKEAFIQKAKEDGTTATDLIVGFMQQYLGIEPKKPVADVNAVDIDIRLSELEQCLSARIAALEEQQPGKSQKAA